MLGELTAKTRYVWIVCHGYGQLARYFIRKFEALKAPDTVILAPEGLSRFYLEGFSGKVGATWMTRENRLVEIENYTSYLNSIYEHIAARVQPETKVIVLGFSQGTATVCRWVLHQDLAIHHLVLWAGEFPPDIDKSMAAARLKDLRTSYVFGTGDPFITEERIRTQMERLKELSHSPGVLEFQGGHDIQAETLERLRMLIFG